MISLRYRIWAFRFRAPIVLNMSRIWIPTVILEQLLYLNALHRWMCLEKRSRQPLSKILKNFVDPRRHLSSLLSRWTETRSKLITAQIPDIIKLGNILNLDFKMSVVWMAMSRGWADTIQMYPNSVRNVVMLVSQNVWNLDGYSKTRRSVIKHRSKTRQEKFRFWGRENSRGQERKSVKWHYCNKEWRW